MKKRGSRQRAGPHHGAPEESRVRASLGADEAIDHTSEDYVSVVAELTQGQGANVVFDTIGGDTLTRSPLVLADAGRVVSIVDIAQPQNLIEAWGKNAAYHFVFTRQNRGKLDGLTTLIERGLIKPMIGAVIPLARVGEAHELLKGGSSLGLRGKVAIDVMGQTVELPATLQIRGQEGSRHPLGLAKNEEVMGLKR